MISPWWRNRINEQFEQFEPNETRLMKKVIAWGLMMLFIFVIGVQVGIHAGRKMGRIEAKQEMLEHYQKIVKDADYYSVK